MLEDFKEKFSEPPSVSTMASNGVGHLSYIVNLGRKF